MYSFDGNEPARFLEDFRLLVPEPYQFDKGRHGVDGSARAVINGFAVVVVADFADPTGTAAVGPGNAFGQGDTFLIHGNQTVHSRAEG